MSKTARILLWTAASVSLALALSETAIRTLDLFERARLATFDPGDEDGVAVAAPADFQVHPFLGWTWRPGLNANFPLAFPDGQLSEWASLNSRTNRHGRLSGLEDYRDLGDEYFVVGVFGGSVASDLATLAGDRLMEAVAAQRPDLGASLVVVNMASPGHKQPQHAIDLLLAMTLGIRFDVVVNIDGFSQVVYGGSDAASGQHPLYPARRFWNTALDFSTGAATPEALEVAGEIARSRRLGHELRDSVRPRWSAVARSIAGARIMRLEKRAVELEDELQLLSAERPDGANIAPLDDPCLPSEVDCVELIGDIWEASSLGMHGLARQIGAHYLHLLQPNQYVADSKRLTPEEEGLYHKPGGRAALVELGYPVLQDRGKSLVRQGVAFHDLTQLFADQSQTIYRDACCRYNLLGNQIMAQRLATLLLEAFPEAGR